MREIKFRCWDKRNNQMLEVFGITWKDILFPNKNPALLGVNKEGENFILKFDECELIEYTGLHDINGKEIYEGDILLCDDNGEFFEDKYDEEKDEYIPCVKQEVFWFGCMWWLRNIGKPNEILDIEYNPFSGDDINFTILGNIYENPELLKEEKQ